MARNASQIILSLYFSSSCLLAISDIHIFDSAIVYRALLRKQWFDAENQEITPDAFYLRKKKNEVGLSVNIASTCSPEQCAVKFTTT